MLRPLALAAALLLAAASCAHGPEAKARSPRDEAYALLKADQPEQAAPRLLQLHLADPGDLDVARWLVDAHVQSGTTEKLLPRLLAPWPAHEEVRHYMLGLLRFGRSAGEAKAAVDELQQAVALAPRIAELHYRLGLVLLETEAYAPAAAELRQ